MCSVTYHFWNCPFIIPSKSLLLHDLINYECS